MRHVQALLRRCTSCVCQRVWKDVLLLFIVTFCVILPCISLRLRHTMYERFIPKNEAKEKVKLQKENTERLNKSFEYLKHVDENSFYKTVNFGRHKGDGQFPRMDYTLTVTIITVSRNRHTISSYEPKYLTQTVASFLELLDEETFRSRRFKVGLFICNVDPLPDSYAEVKALPRWIKTFQRFSHNGVPLSNMAYDAIIDKEKQDYVYCLEQSLAQNVSHVLLVEDDALPLPDLFPVIDQLVFSNFGHVGISSSSNITYFKLYHPERLLGYISLEFERIPELLSLSCIFATFLLWMNTKWSSRSLPVTLLWAIFFIYSGLFFLALGRVNVIEFRRLSKYLYQLTPAPTCCTPAMLFPREGGKVVADYLNSVTCKSKFAKDTALDAFRKKKGLIARMVQPNLFKHIGQFSTLRSELVNPFIV